MQDRYAGDIGDYIKFGLLRSLGTGRKVGVAWYRYPDEGHNDDGKHTSYLKKPDTWRGFDPELFGALGKVVATSRSLSALEEQRILDAKYSGSFITKPLNERLSNADHRTRWFSSVKHELAGCDLVFADPDNGLSDDNPERRKSKRFGKSISLAEALELCEDRVGVIYHHNTRFKGGHDKEVDHWLRQLGSDTIAVRANAFNCRTFFIVHPDTDIRKKAEAFCRHWEGAKVRLHGQ